MTEQKDDLTRLEHVLGYTFTDKTLLDLARTHASRNKVDNFERLEYLGDAILGTVVREWAMENTSKRNNAHMHKVATVAVANAMLGIVARRLGLPDHLHMSPEEACGDMYNYSKKYADFLEALIGAIYKDGGLEAARDFILRNLPLDTLLTLQPDQMRLLSKVHWSDSKKELNTLLKHANGGEPEYAYVRQVGRYQVWKVTTDLGVAEGRGQVGLENDLGAKHARGNAASKLVRKLAYDHIEKLLFPNG